MKVRRIHWKAIAGVVVAVLALAVIGVDIAIFAAGRSRPVHSFQYIQK
jgi:hypothetical protein